MFEDIPKSVFVSEKTLGNTKIAIYKTDENEYFILTTQLVENKEYIISKGVLTNNKLIEEIVKDFFLGKTDIN